jgi:uncharacterized membrane protein YdbT with pleckstrin-like domain
VAYPDKALQDDEKIVEHLHPHWITLVPATLWFIVICVLGGLGIGFAPDKGVGREIVIIAVIVIGLGLLAWLTFKPLIEWRTTHYVFTTHRVLIRRGVLRHTGRDISLQRISDVAFTQSLWDRIVKAGTVTIESAGEHGQETLTDVPKSEQQQQMLNRLIEEDSMRRQRAAQQGFVQAPPTDAQGQPYPTQQYSQPYPPQGQQYPPQQGPPYPPTQQYPPQN